jgi:AraC family transcriptional regulator
LAEGEFGLRSSLVFESSSVVIVDVCCGPGPLPPSGIEVEPAFAIGFPRRGVYVHETRTGSVVADPTVALFRSEGDEQKTRHPTTEGDANTEIQFPASIVEPLLDRHGRFRRRSVPIADSLAIRHLRLLALAQSNSPTQLEIEEEALSLLRLAHSVPLQPEAYHPLIGNTREQLASSYQEDVDLATIAQRVGSSPFHLSRVFKQSTGISMSAYRSTLRIRHVLNGLAGGAGDLARLAVEAGFYDHAHMTTAFRRRVGSVPSVMRSLLVR